MINEYVKNKKYDSLEHEINEILYHIFNGTVITVVCRITTNEGITILGESRQYCIDNYKETIAKREALDEAMEKLFVKLFYTE